MAVSDAAPMRRPGIIGWETEVADLPRLMLGMLPVIAPADVWAQLAVPGATGVDPDTGSRRRLTSDWLVAVGDYLLTGPRIGRARVPLCTRDDLMRAIQRRRRKRGVKDLALALDRVRPGAHSPRETLLRLGLVDHGLPEPDVQVPVVTAAGLRHADLGYPDARLLLEYQGDHHRTDRRQWLEDLTRVQLLQDAGYDVMVVGAADIVPDSAALAACPSRARPRTHARRVIREHGSRDFAYVARCGVSADIREVSRGPTDGGRVRSCPRCGARPRCPCAASTRPRGSAPPPRWPRPGRRPTGCCTPRGSRRS